MSYTKLDIINEMVVSTGLRAFAAEQSQHPAYIKAERVLKQVSLSVLDRGLWFNTECRTLPLDVDSEINLPTNCIKADPVDGNINLTKRGNRMYDLDAGSYTLTEAPILKMRFSLDLYEMPVTAQEYIRAKCVYKFYLDEDGAGPKLNAYKASADEGWMWLWREHIRSRQANVFSGKYNTVNRLRRGQAPYNTGTAYKGGF